MIDKSGQGIGYHSYPWKSPKVFRKRVILDLVLHNSIPSTEDIALVFTIDDARTARRARRFLYAMAREGLIARKLLYDVPESEFKKLAEIEQMRFELWVTPFEGSRVRPREKRGSLLWRLITEGFAR